MILAEPVLLPPRLDLSSAPQVLSDLIAVKDDTVIAIDASKVVHFGALGLQIVLSCARHANAHGNQIEISGVSERVEAQLAAMGTSAELIMECSK